MGCVPSGDFFGLIYQWLANRRHWDLVHESLDEKEKERFHAQRAPWMPALDRLAQSIVYLLMSVFFFAGAVAFVCFAWNTFWT